MFGASVAKYFANIDNARITEQYQNNGSFGSNVRVGVSNPIKTTTPVSEPTVSLGGFDYSVPNIAVPKYDSNLAYEGVSSPMYGKPNINGRLLDLPYC